MQVLDGPSRFPCKSSSFYLLAKTLSNQVGFYTEDGIFPPTPGMVRGVEEVVQMLRKAGHQVPRKLGRLGSVEFGNT